MSDVLKLNHIAFTVTGAGRPLFLVGAPAGLAGFAKLAAALASDFLVVTHDPRGTGASELEGGAPVDPEALAQDLAALISHLAGGPVDVFGSSGGAVTCLELLRARPELVRHAVLHEPPLFTLLPDSATILEEADRAFSVALSDPQQGLQRFSDLTEVLHATREEQPRPQPIALPPLPPTEMDRQRFALGVMAPATVHYVAPADLPAQASVDVAAGAESVGQPARRAASALADLLGRPLLEAPGNHLAPSTRPAEFADWLRGAFAAIPRI